MNQSDNQLVFALLKAASFIERKLDRSLACTKGVSFTEYQLLNELQVKYKGAATRVDLADAVRLTPSAVTRALKPLEKIGYVVTEKSDRDARRSIATLTEAGRTLLEDATKIVNDEIKSMSLTSANRADVLDMLSNVHTR